MLDLFAMLHSFIVLEEVDTFLGYCSSP